MSDGWTEPEGYCKAGAHYIGDADECWRCELWESQKTAMYVFDAARHAHRLKRAAEDHS